MIDDYLIGVNLCDVDINVIGMGWSPEKQGKMAWKCLQLDLEFERI